MQARFSIERLVHFRCEACGGWWTIGDAPERAFWFCPWCGQRLDLGPVLEPLAAPQEPGPKPKE